MTPYLSAAAAHEEAVLALLDNPGAQVREAALDALVAQARAEPVRPMRLPPPCVRPAQAGPEPGRPDAPGEAVLLDAARRGEAARLAAHLAASAGVPCAAVHLAAAARSGKGLVSLAWKAGFSMRAALAAQAVLAQLGPGEVLEPGPGGAFPLSPAEMEFHIGVLLDG